MISVIVPVYKSEKTLERCVKSILKQTDPGLELLLIVNGPPDHSGVLCDKLAETDPRIRVIHQKDRGVSNARNRGIKEARGDYVRFVDSDDFVDADSNALLLSALQRQDADLVIAGFRHLYFGRDILKLPQEGVYDLAALSKEEGGALAALYTEGYLNMPWNKLYKRELLKTGFPTDLDLGEDLLFNQAYIREIGRMAVIAAPVCNYIQDGRGTTLSTAKRTDRIPVAFRLYRETTAFFAALCVDGCHAPAAKVAVEFLDCVEELAFDVSVGRAEKKTVIRQYENALFELGEERKRVTFSRMDYKLIYPFLVRGCTNMVYLLVCCRGLIVKLLKKRG